MSTVNRPLEHDDLSGTPVRVVLDNQEVVDTWTRSETWTVGSNQVVLLSGFSGAYLVKRCSVDETRSPRGWFRKCGGCPKPGVGGQHSDSYGEDGTGRCAWCGASPGQRNDPCGTGYE